MFAVVRPWEFEYPTIHHCHPWDMHKPTRKNWAYPGYCQITQLLCEVEVGEISGCRGLKMLPCQLARCTPRVPANYTVGPCPG